MKASELNKGDKFVRLDEVDPNRVGNVLVAGGVLGGRMFCARKYNEIGTIQILYCDDKVMRLDL